MVVVVGDTVTDVPVPIAVPPHDPENHSMVPTPTLDVSVAFMPEQMMAPPKVGSLRSVVMAAGTAGAVVKVTSEPYAVPCALVA